MTKSYKDASKIVDEMETADVPSLEQIVAYSDLQYAKAKAIWMRRYVEAIRVEKTGREIHHKRFFLKGDHKIRLKFLEKKMVKSIDVMDALETRAFDLQFAKNPAYNWIKPFQAPRTSNHKEEVDKSKGVSLSDVLTLSEDSNATPVVQAPAEESEDDDPIELVLRAEKREYLGTYRLLRESREAWVERISPEDRNNADVLRALSIKRDAILQFARRVVLHDPALLLKAEGKVSFNDLFLDPSFTLDDFEKFERGQQQAVGRGMIWWKDAVLDALAIWPKAGKAGTAANLGRLGESCQCRCVSWLAGAASYCDPEDRFKIVGGWVFKDRHQKTMSKEGWYTFMSFGTIGMVPPPSWCAEYDAELFRLVLSFCGVVLGDIVGAVRNIGPMPTNRKASRRGHIKWFEVSRRVYTFGAVRNEPHALTDAFFREIRARPDKFVVITRSETDPGQQIEQFGGGNDETFYQYRTRTFEAPSTLGTPTARTRTVWNIMRSGKDVFYGTGEPIRVPGAPAESLPSIKGYLTEIAAERNGGWLFWLKKDRFHVKYFVIMANDPATEATELMRDLSWAALCAAGYAKGAFTMRTYTEAVDAMMRKRWPELMGWMPPAVGRWTVPSIMEQAKKDGVDAFMDMADQLNLDVLVSHYD
ncbi:uncharacterized protein LAESUDRAFT_735345 [Laetiporus sulphureus 93-53]|uniref:Uncharacterized protein n=1 Tax=Laetiporus sulphureus 93-53 TaxID=1314785 RepID=A0A165G1B9_9APHY|nr:uncharacterized protein LAESUDRAFT_735345 [Laetiporus sulphureus 93-53]KZT09697.1 hypothetical protein LAESUDRAFT_735345 [Laetiporus sulphureus 93-53]